MAIKSSTWTDPTTSRFVVVVSFISVLSLAIYFYLGAQARMALDPLLPAPATSETTLLLRFSGVCAGAAGLWSITKCGWRIRPAYAISIALLSSFVIGTELLLWSAAPVSTALPTVTATAILLLFPTAWCTIADRQIIAVLSPLVTLCGLSVCTYVLSGQYLFPWYNRWGLIAAVLIATAVALRDISTRARIAIVLVGGLSVTLSSSRQALAAVFLLAAVWLLQTNSLGVKVRRLAVAAIAISLIYSVVGASERVEVAGGIGNSNGRDALFESGWSAVSRSPIYGLADDKPNSELGASLKSVGLGWSTSVHDFVLDSWLRGGLLAALSAIALIAAVVWPRYRRGRLLGSVLLPFFLLGSELLYFGDTVAALLIAAAYGIGMSGAERSLIVRGSRRWRGVPS
jgi:O-antigen ligase